MTCVPCGPTGGFCKEMTLVFQLLVISRVTRCRVVLDLACPQLDLLSSDNAVEAHQVLADIDVPARYEHSNSQGMTGSPGPCCCACPRVEQPFQVPTKSSENGVEMQIVACQVL